MWCSFLLVDLLCIHWSLQCSSHPSALIPFRFVQCCCLGRWSCVFLCRMMRDTWYGYVFIHLILIRTPNLNQASFDGRHRIELGRGDSVVVRASRFFFPSLCLQDPTVDWFKSLSRCLHWNERGSGRKKTTSQE